LDRGSKKSGRLHDYLMKQTPSETAVSQSQSVDNDSLDTGLRKALEHRDRLLEYDKTRYDRFKNNNDDDYSTLLTCSEIYFSKTENSK